MTPYRILFSLKSGVLGTMACTWPYLSAHFLVALKAQTYTFVLRKPKLLSLYQIMSPISLSLRVHLVVEKTGG